MHHPPTVSREQVDRMLDEVLADDPRSMGQVVVDGLRRFDDWLDRPDNAITRNAHELGRLGLRIDQAVQEGESAKCLDRADRIIRDILDNHLPRIEEGLRAGYVDENQILIIYDHAVRARILKEHAKD